MLRTWQKILSRHFYLKCEVIRLNCPICGGKTKVIDTRHTSNNETYRKKRCENCGEIFFTLEFDVSSILSSGKFEAS